MLCLPVLNHVSALVKLASDGIKPRPREHEPTVLGIYGPPGIGKSLIWRTIVQAIYDPKYKNSKILDELTHTYSRSEYQTGMIGKKNILFDDFGQRKDNCDEFIALIELATRAPYQPLS